MVTVVKFEQRYEITGNEEDFVKTEEIVDYLINTCKLRVSPNKIGRVLKERGVVSKIVKVEGVNGQYKLGVRERSLLNSLGVEK